MHAAVSDVALGLVLAWPANIHARSLWRRVQAYDMKGMARESLLDCLDFAGAWLDGRNTLSECGVRREPEAAKLPYCIAWMISK
jgi:hypothetical protein